LFTIEDKLGLGVDGDVLNLPFEDPVLMVESLERAGARKSVERALEVLTLIASSRTKSRRNSVLTEYDRLHSIARFSSAGETRNMTTTARTKGPTKNPATD
jgi:hypothetical protein